MARTLDCYSKLSLVSCAASRDPSRQDLSPFGDKLSKPYHVLVINVTILAFFFLRMPPVLLGLSECSLFLIYGIILSPLKTIVYYLTQTVRSYCLHSLIEWQLVIYLIRYVHEAVFGRSGRFILGSAVLSGASALRLGIII